MPDFRLDRLSNLEAIVGPTFRPTQAMQRRWQVFCQKIEEAFDSLDDRVTEIEAAMAAAAAADTKARAHMDDLPDVTIEGDYTGAIDSSQFPFTINVKRFDGTTNVSSSSTWAVTVETGDVDCSIGAATGVLTVNDASVNSLVRIESTRDGLTLRRKQAFKVELADPPNTGGTGGGTVWTDTSFNSTNSTTMAAISDELTVTVGSSGEVDLSAPLTVRTNAIAGDGTYKVWGIWQWWDGAAWTDLGSEVDSGPDCVIIDGEVNEGSLAISASKTGLVAAASEKFRLMARNDSSSATMTYSGTASAVS